MEHLSAFIAHVMAVLILMGAFASLAMAHSVSTRPRQRLLVVRAALSRLESLDDTASTRDESSLHAAQPAHSGRRDTRSAPAFPVPVLYPHLHKDPVRWEDSLDRAHAAIDEQLAALEDDAEALEKLTGVDRLAEELSALPLSPATHAAIEAVEQATTRTEVERAAAAPLDPPGHFLAFWRSAVGRKLLVGLANSLGAKVAIGGALGLVLGVAFAVLDPDVTHSSLISTASDVSFIVGAVLGGAAFFIALFRSFPRARHHHWFFGFAVRYPLIATLLIPLVIATAVVAIRAALLA